MTAMALDASELRKSDLMTNEFSCSFYFDFTFFIIYDSLLKNNIKCQLTFLFEN